MDTFQKGNVYFFPFWLTDLNIFLFAFFFHSGHIFKRIIWIATIWTKKLLLIGNS